MENDDRNKILVFDVPTNGNLGDQALVYATDLFLLDHFPQYDVIHVANDEINSGLNSIAKKVRQSDIILWNGGGNLGTIYPSAEYSRWDVMNKMPQTKMVVFPQSVSFKLGSTAFEKKSIREYGKKNNLTVFLREEQSYRYFKHNFEKTNSKLTPDIVFYLAGKNLLADNKHERNGVLTLLRNDIEKSIDDIDKFQDDLTNLVGPITNSDTYVSNIYVNDSDRKELLYKKWNEISSYRLVVTDRLHGMIFAYITGTPAIVFQNSNWKISSTFETWLLDVGFIRMADAKMEKSAMRELIDEVMNSKIRVEDFSDRFQLIEEALGKDV
ncbi:polysaccharide pyruvyl transferase family protein [Weissella confusa]|uniref:polysaccharide pyruvyl transferase family protein n=1 Tax=Weissella confusa TaxID=1583 RepID=UPI0018F1E650|nr:polysaccharide pyruvyl transferase family protein [Weissella confusa]MBJ7671165.1 hypothetical protein [Weissella confusa]